MIVDVKFSELSQKLNLKFGELAQRIDTKFKENSQNIDIGFGDINRVTKYVGGEIYTGDYAVTPRVTEQVLPTKEKVIASDLTVKAIPFFGVTNPSGGLTVVIGREG